MLTVILASRPDTPVWDIDSVRRNNARRVHIAETGDVGSITQRMLWRLEELNLTEACEFVLPSDKDAPVYT